MLGLGKASTLVSLAIGLIGVAVALPIIKKVPAVYRGTEEILSGIEFGVESFTSGITGLFSEAKTTVCDTDFLAGNPLCEQNTIEVTDETGIIDIESIDKTVKVCEIPFEYKSNPFKHDQCVVTYTDKENNCVTSVNEQCNTDINTQVCEAGGGGWNSLTNVCFKAEVDEEVQKDINKTAEELGQVNVSDCEAKGGIVTSPYPSQYICVEKEPDIIDITSRLQGVKQYSKTYNGLIESCNNFCEENDGVIQGLDNIRNTCECSDATEARVSLTEITDFSTSTIDQILRSSYASNPFGEEP